MSAEKSNKKPVNKKKNAESPKNEKKEILIKELKGILPKLDEVGLIFLIEQANIHLYNMQIDELNSKKLITGDVSSKEAKITTKKAAKDLRIEAAGDKSSYYIVYNGQWIMFTDEEMLHLVKIVSGKDSKQELAERLYRWFERERSDVFGVIPIKNQFDEELLAVLELIKKTFKIKFK
jgi:hypothetical protein